MRTISYTVKLSFTLKVGDRDSKTVKLK